MLRYTVRFQSEFVLCINLLKENPFHFKSETKIIILWSVTSMPFRNNGYTKIVSSHGQEWNTVGFQGQFGQNRTL